MVVVSGTNADNLLDLSAVGHSSWLGLGILEGTSMTEDFNIEDLTDEFLVTKRFRDANEFSLYIEEQAKENKMTHMEAVVHYCTENSVDPESIKKLINAQLKDRIRQDAEDAMLMRKTSQLEF